MMENKEIVEKVNEVLQEQMYLDESPNPEDHLMNDLAFDSLDAVELIMELEKKFSIKLPDEEVENMKTVQDVVNVVAKYIS